MTDPAPETTPEAPPDAGAREAAERATGSASALRASVHTHLLPQLVDARRWLDRGDVASATAALDRAEEVALDLLRDDLQDDLHDDLGQVPGEDSHERNLDRVLVMAVDRARRDHGQRLHVTTTAPRLPPTTVDPAVAAAVSAVVAEAAANTARHRSLGVLEVHATTATGRLDLVARSSGRPATPPDHEHGTQARGGGMGLHLVRRQVTEAGGTLQVLHDDRATTLVATLPIGGR